MRKNNLREHILNVAGDLFAQKGYGNVGINEIVKTGEIARASFYHHFESKEALCVTWLENMHLNSLAYHHKLLGSDSDPKTIIYDYFKELKKWLIKNNFRGCPYTNTAIFIVDEAPLVREQIQVHKISIRDFFTDLSIRLCPDKGPALGDALFLLYSGATMEAQNLRDTWPVDRALESAAKLCAEITS
ncbi:MAG: TetR/AcrR family transcriptional regulator [Opitutaceae bacterium]